jgi:hypothetical protein
MFCPIALEKERLNKLGMKLKLLLCGVALLAAGCDSQSSSFAGAQNPFATSGEFSYTFDLVPQPIPDISQAELEKIEPSLVTAVAVVPSGTGSSESGGH